ncbi:TetR/AcrR family transcriptional regulator C-terminal domain-containing protein [Actinoallomurus sp. NPDC050550]|uniref:TetR/AcrR family transcriptional regulator C-terminal domain-containing protein n=1 Tax=Actinoallomurus sp. NPDC050550 TaxID=3154937 RepID=UPI0033CCB4C8
MAIDRDHAVRTALRILDAEGLDKLSLRRIATELDVRAPALYWHFANKRALLDHMADVILAPAVPALAGPAHPDEWPQWLLRTAELLRSTLLAHTDGARVALGANLIRAVALGMFVERTAQVLHAAGFSLRDASRAAGSFTWFVVGRTVEEQALPELDATEIEQAQRLFPTVARGVAERQATGDTQEEAFRYSVQIMIAGLRTLRREAAENSPGPGRGG